MAFPKDEELVEKTEVTEPSKPVKQRFKQERSLKEINEELRANRPVAKAPKHPPRAGFEPEAKGKKKK